MINTDNEATIKNDIRLAWVGFHSRMEEAAINTGEMLTVRFVRRNPRITIKQICERFHWSRTKALAHLNSLVFKGYVTKELKGRTYHYTYALKE